MLSRTIITIAMTRATPFSFAMLETILFMFLLSALCCFISDISSSYLPVPDANNRGKRSLLCLSAGQGCCLSSSRGNGNPHSPYLVQFYRRICFSGIIQYVAKLESCYVIGNNIIATTICISGKTGLICRTCAAADKGINYGIWMRRTSSCPDNHIAFHKTNPWCGSCYGDCRPTP